MILWFATKRNVNGHRKYLGIDTGKNEYAKPDSSRVFLLRTDFTEISATDMKRMEQELVVIGFRKVDMV